MNHAHFMLPSLCVAKKKIVDRLTLSTLLMNDSVNANLIFSAHIIFILSFSSEYPYIDKTKLRSLATVSRFHQLRGTWSNCRYSLLRGKLWRILQRRACLEVNVLFSDVTSTSSGAQSKTLCTCVNVKAPAQKALCSRGAEEPKKVKSNLLH